MAPVRDELYMKIALSKPHNRSRLIELARSQEEDCLVRMHSLKQPLGQGGALKAWSEVAVLLVRDAEIKQLEARVEWLQKARAVMQRLHDTQARCLARGDRVA